MSDEVYDSGTSDAEEAHAVLVRLWEEERERLGGLGRAAGANVVSRREDPGHASASLVHPAKGVLDHVTFEIVAPGPGGSD